MNFDLSTDQQLLASSAAAFVKRESPVRRARALRQDPLGFDRQMWKKMAELGWLGLIVPEAQGGIGGSFVDAAVLLEQLGGALVPEPFVPAVILAGSALSRLGDDAQRARWLAPLIAGDITLALAYAERAQRYSLAAPGTSATPTADGYRLQGEKIFVLNAQAADAIVVSATAPAGTTLFVLSRSTPGVTIAPIALFDGRRAATVRFADAQVGREARLGAEGGGAALLDELIDLGAAAACAEGVGLLRVVLEMTRQYLCTREQFGTKIGAFQALQHRAADMFVQLELAISTSMLASVAAATLSGDERRGAISAAKVQLARSGRFITQQAIQLHGGIAITDEHDLGLYFKRMHALATLFGDEEHHVGRYASLPAFAG